MSDYREIDAEQLRLWKNEGLDYVLLDVRQPEELKSAAVPGAINVPMREVQQRVREIPRGKPIVVMCHYGERSSRIARFLLTDGFSEVYNLDGGIDAYALHIDPTIGRY
jgi:rhodanese-related sulfurtransferase